MDHAFLTGFVERKLSVFSTIEIQIFQKTLILPNSSVTKKQEKTRSRIENLPLKFETLSYGMRLVSVHIIWAKKLCGRG